MYIGREIYFKELVIAEAWLDQNCRVDQHAGNREELQESVDVIPSSSSKVSCFLLVV